MSKEVRKHINMIIEWKNILKESKKTNPYIYDDKNLVGAIEDSIEKNKSSFICTFVAQAVKMLEGDRVKIYGFSTKKNPEAQYFVEENGIDDYEGHHFAVMDGRYIVDPWIYNNFYEDGIFGRSVFDLQNKKDEEFIKYLYGDEDNWTDITNKLKGFEELFPLTYEELLDFYNQGK